MVIGNLDLEERNLRTTIITLLGKESQLSTKEIFELINLENRRITYPAVYKTLKMLTREKKLTKQYRKFSLNMDWIKELKRFIETIEHTSDFGSLPALEHFNKENTSEIFFFNSYGDADIYRKELQMDYQLEYYPKNKVPYCAFYRHFKSPVIKSEKILQEIKTLKERKHGGFLIGGFDTPIDRWCQRFYTRNPKISVKIVPGLTNVDSCETMILGDVVVQTYLPENVKKLTDSIYKKTRSIEDVDALEFYEKVYKSSEKTKMIVFNNRHIAEALRNQVLRYFRKK